MGLGHLTIAIPKSEGSYTTPPVIRPRVSDRAPFAKSISIIFLIVCSIIPTVIFCVLFDAFCARCTRWTRKFFLANFYFQIRYRCARSAYIQAE